MVILVSGIPNTELQLWRFQSPTLDLCVWLQILYHIFLTSTYLCIGLEWWAASNRDKGEPHHIKVLQQLFNPFN